MTVQVVIDVPEPLDLRSHAASYYYDEQKFALLERTLIRKIEDYDPAYGPYLRDHLERTSRYLEEFMIFNGKDAEFATKISRAFKLHDIGKIMQNIEVWEKTNEKPAEEKKALRAQHVFLGEPMILQTVEELGIDLTADDQRHIDTIVYFIKTHHERINGHGPMGFTGDDMDDILKMATILDELDGKTKLEGTHHDLDSLFNDLRTRHSDRFDSVIVERCYDFCKKFGCFFGQNTAPPPAYALQY